MERRRRIHWIRFCIGGRATFVVGYMHGIVIVIFIKQSTRQVLLLDAPKLELPFFLSTLHPVCTMGVGCLTYLASTALHRPIHRQPSDTYARTVLRAPNSTPYLSTSLPSFGTSLIGVKPQLHASPRRHARNAFKSNTQRNQPTKAAPSRRNVSCVSSAAD